MRETYPELENLYEKISIPVIQMFITLWKLQVLESRYINAAEKLHRKIEWKNVNTRFIITVIYQGINNTVLWLTRDSYLRIVYRFPRLACRGKVRKADDLVS